MSCFVFFLFLFYRKHTHPIIQNYYIIISSVVSFVSIDWARTKRQATKKRERARERENLDVFFFLKRECMYRQVSE